VFCGGQVRDLSENWQKMQTSAGQTGREKQLVSAVLQRC
jgi:hypothetical protein